MKITIFYIFSALLLLSSCFKKNDQELEIENYNADWAAQIINSEFNIADLLDRSDTNNLSLIIEGDDIILSYSETVKAALSESFYQLPDQNVFGEHTQATTVPPSGQSDQPFPPVTIDLSTSLANPPLDFNGADISDAQLKEILVDKGLLELTINNTYQHTLFVDLIVSSVSLNGQVLNFSNVIVQPGSTVVSVKKLDNHVIDLKDESTGDLNSLMVQANLSGILNGNNPLLLGDKLTFSLDIKNISYQHVIGKLGTFTIPLEKGDNEISLFDDLDSDGEFHLETFDLKTTVITDWGVPLEMSISDLNFLNNKENTQTGVIGGIDELVNIDALNNVNLVGKEAITTETFFSSELYPDLKKVIAIEPTDFNYDMTFAVNPNNNPSENLFVSKESTIETRVEAQFYLHGYLRGFSRRDTISDIDLSDGDNTYVQKAILRFIFENGMPLQLGVDLLFLDENDQVIDQELDKIKINGAQVDLNGNAVGATTNTIDIILDEERMMEIGPKVRKIVLVSKLDSEGADLSKNVHIRPQDKMRIIIGVRATIDQDLN